MTGHAAILYACCWALLMVLPVAADNGPREPGSIPPSDFCRVFSFSAAYPGSHGKDTAGDMDRQNCESTRRPGTSAGPTDWPGIRRDFYYFLGYSVVSNAIVFAAPESVSHWTDEEKDELGLEQWLDNIGHLTWDEDDWFINYVTHPYWGAAYYIRARERGLNRTEAFWVSALFSATYEFGIESFLEQPSIQDLIVTPVFGTLLGFWFEDLRMDIRAKGDPYSRGDRALLILTDPLGALNRTVNRWFGINENADARIRFQPGWMQTGVQTGHGFVQEQPEAGNRELVPALLFDYRF